MSCECNDDMAEQVKADDTAAAPQLVELPAELRRGRAGQNSAHFMALEPSTATAFLIDTVEAEVQDDNADTH